MSPDLAQRTSPGPTQQVSPALARQQLARRSHATRQCPAGGAAAGRVRRRVTGPPADPQRATAGPCAGCYYRTCIPYHDTVLQGTSRSVRREDYCAPAPGNRSCSTQHMKFYSTGCTLCPTVYRTSAAPCPYAPAAPLPPTAFLHCSTDSNTQRAAAASSPLPPPAAAPPASWPWPAVGPARAGGTPSPQRPRRRPAPRAPPCSITTQSPGAMRASSQSRLCKESYLAAPPVRPIRPQGLERQSAAIQGDGPRVLPVAAGPQKQRGGATCTPSALLPHQASACWQCRLQLPHGSSEVVLRPSHPWR